MSSTTHVIAGLILAISLLIVVRLLSLRRVKKPVVEDLGRMLYLGMFLPSTRPFEMKKRR